MTASDLYAVFGNPVAHSLSPRIHTLFAQQCGHNLRYEHRQPATDAFAQALHEFMEEGGRGANVTLPFKEIAYSLATQLTPRARLAGAVNTLSWQHDGVIQGDNTDGAGLLSDLRHNLHTPLAGQRILLLGAGGAARGVLHPLLAEKPQHLCLANRNAAKAQALIADITCRDVALTAGGFDCITEHTEAFDVIINATASGLTHAVLPLPDSIFAPNALAYEMLYGKTTPFMQQAKNAGARISDGLGMLVEQAALAFCIWRGVPPQTAPVLAQLRQSMSSAQ